MLTSIYRLASILRSIIFKRPIALCDIGDVDGVACAALFKMKFPDGSVVLAAPSDVRESWLLRAASWTFVADLPCPGKAFIRADHHASNSPCATYEFYDPSAPAAAVLALRALDLGGNPAAIKLASLAVETDTARITSEEAVKLNDAVKGSRYRGKLRLVELLASKPLEEVLSDPRVRGAIERYRLVREVTERLAAEAPPDEFFIAIFERDLKLSYRYLCILMEKRGAKVTAVVVPKGLTSIRVYLGSASKEYDVSKVAVRLGGGGHPYAAGATIRHFARAEAVARVLRELAALLNRQQLNVLVVKRGGLERRVWP